VAETGLQATIAPQGELEIGSPIRIVLVVTNGGDRPVTLPNPDMGTPPDELAWTFGQETYQIATLKWLGLLALAVVDPNGETLDDIGPVPWTSPILRPDLELAPGESMELSMTLTDFVELPAPGLYEVDVGYGPPSGRIWAHTELPVHKGRAEGRGARSSQD